MKELALFHKAVLRANSFKHSVYDQNSIKISFQVTHGSKHGSLIASQMMDVTIRVESIRSFAVRQMSLLLQNHHLLVGHGRGGCSNDVLYAASWICGEFADKLESPEATLKAMCKR